MIHLVLEDAGPQPARRDGDRIPELVLGFETDPFGALHLREDARDGQAAFLGEDLPALVRDHGVDERARLAAFVVAHDHSRSEMPTCGAARPRPISSYIVSIMSAIMR